MNNLQDVLFSPLGKEWCLYYFILLVITFLALLMSIVTSIGSLFMAKKFTFVGLFKNTIMPIVTNLIVYLLARLAYSICAGALH